MKPYKRLKAFADAGADCLYAPGIKTREEIRTVADSVAPKPVNILIGWPSILSVQDVAALGAGRISVGGSLARSSVGVGFMRAARQIADGGSFGGFADAAPAADSECILPRGSQEAAGGMSELPRFQAGARPGAVTLTGRYGSVVKLDPFQHSAALWNAIKDRSGSVGAICLMVRSRAPRSLMRGWSNARR